MPMIIKAYQIFIYVFLGALALSAKLSIADGFDDLRRCNGYDPSGHQQQPADCNNMKNTRQNGITFANVPKVKPTMTDAQLLDASRQLQALGEYYQNLTKARKDAALADKYRAAEQERHRQNNDIWANTPEGQQELATETQAQSELGNDLADKFRDKLKLDDNWRTPTREELNEREALLKAETALMVERDRRKGIVLTGHEGYDALGAGNKGTVDSVKASEPTQNSEAGFAPSGSDGPTNYQVLKESAAQKIQAVKDEVQAQIDEVKKKIDDTKEKVKSVTSGKFLDDTK